MSSGRSRSGGSVHGDRVDAVVEILRGTRPCRIASARSRLVAATMRTSTRAGPGAADPEERAGLQRAQQLHLAVGLHLADLVEEERAAVGQLDEPGLGGDRAGEGALLVTEQLGLEHLARQRAAVDRHEGPLGARASARGSRAPPAPCRCRSRRASRTEESVGATRSTMRSTSCILALRVRMPPKGSAPGAWARSATLSRRSWPFSAALRTRTSSSSIFVGLVR